MEKMRAYKIAEELGIDRNDLIDKAKAVGVELKSPMVQLEEDEASQLRQKLSGHIPGAQVTERRVESQGGAAVIRRRKRAPEPAAPTHVPGARAAGGRGESRGGAAVIRRRKRAPEPAAPAPPPRPEPVPEPVAAGVPDPQADLEPSESAKPVEPEDELAPEPTPAFE